MGATLLTVVTVLEALMKYQPIVVKTAAILFDFGSVLYSQLSGGKELTPEQSADLEKKVDELFERVMAKELPPAQPGDPDYVKEP